MKKLIVAVVALTLFAHQVRAEEMPGTSKTSSLWAERVPTMKEEIEFEKEKLVSYSDASKASKGNRLPLVCLVGCYADDVQLYLQLKGRVTLCYLPSKAAPFTTVESGVVVGLWDAKGETCVRHDVAAFTFSDAKFRDALLFNPAKPQDNSVTTTVTSVPTTETFIKRGNTYYSTTTGLPMASSGWTETGQMDCSSGQCRPTYIPATRGGFLPRK